jgi:hypothetical protein
MSILPRAIDERFFAHRLRSTSTAGLAGACVAWALLMYRFYVQHRFSWDLLTVIATMAAVKVVLMAWYYTRD